VIIQIQIHDITLTPCVIIQIQIHDITLTPCVIIQIQIHDITLTPCVIIQIQIHDISIGHYSYTMCDYTNTNTRQFYSAKIKIFYCALQTHIANMDIKTKTSNQTECTIQDSTVLSAVCLQLIIK